MWAYVLRTLEFLLVFLFYLLITFQYFSTFAIGVHMFQFVWLFDITKCTDHPQSIACFLICNRSIQICFYTMEAENLFICRTLSENFSPPKDNDLTRFQTFELSFVLITSEEFLFSALATFCPFAIDFRGPNPSDGFISFLFVFKWVRMVDVALRVTWAIWLTYVCFG